MDAQQIADRFQERVVDVEGRFGLAAWPVGKPEQAIGLNMDESFPTASVFKVPVLYALYQMHDRGEVDLSKRIRIEREHLVPGSGVLQDLGPGLEPTIRDLAVLMIVLSDNQATDMLYSLVGADRIHTAMDELGLHRTRVPMPTKQLLFEYVGLDVNNPEHTYEMSIERMRNDEYNYDAASWSDVDGSGNDLTTPRELARLCEAIEQGVGVSAAARDDMLDIMKRQKFNDRIPAGVPEKTIVAHKTGSLKGVRNDAGIVYAPSGPYTVAIFSKRLGDENVGVKTMADLSKIVWETFS